MFLLDPAAKTHNFWAGLVISRLLLISGQHDHVILQTAPRLQLAVFICPQEKL